MLHNSKRIAKNTLLLYIRTFMIMAITLYTSRVVLNVLGVENYGIAYYYATYKVIVRVVVLWLVSNFDV